MYSSLIFCGRRLGELQKWRNLNVTVKIASCVFNSFSSAAQDRKPFGVSYLVDSLGFTRKRAESISRKVGSEVNPDSVLDLLTNHGFTESQIADIINSYPRLLMLDAEKSLAPKLQFLQSRGASTSELTKILSQCPHILGMRWHKTISREYDFYKEFIEVVIESHMKMKLVENASHMSLFRSYGFTDYQIANINRVYPEVLMLDADKSLAPKLKFLQSIAGSTSELTEILTKVPKILGMKGEVTLRRDYDCVKYIICLGQEKFKKSLNKLIEMGFDPTTPQFVIALSVVCKSSDKAIEDEVSFYKKLGFDVEDVRAVFKKMNTKLVVDSHDTC